MTVDVENALFIFSASLLIQTGSGAGASNCILDDFAICKNIILSINKKECLDPDDENLFINY